MKRFLLSLSLNQSSRLLTVDSSVGVCVCVCNVGCCFGSKRVCESTRAAISCNHVDSENFPRVNLNIE